MKIECVFLHNTIPMKSQSEWVFPLLFLLVLNFFHHRDAARFSSASSFFLLFSSLESSSTYSYVCTTMNDRGEDEEKIEKQTSLHYTSNIWVWVGFPSIFHAQLFFLLFFCYSTHRIYIMMEILNLLIYFISYFSSIRDFIFLSIFALLVNFVRRSAIILRFIDFFSSFFHFSPSAGKVIHHKSSINIMKIYCSRVR